MVLVEVVVVVVVVVIVVVIVAQMVVTLMLVVMSMEVSLPTHLVDLFEPPSSQLSTNHCSFGLVRMMNSSRFFVLLLLSLCSLSVQQSTTCESLSQKPSTVSCSRPFTSGSADMAEYRVNYPGRQDDLSRSDNLLFYSDRLLSRPDQLNVSTMLRSWRGDFDTLESRHGYIQWLFPVQSRSGANSASQELFPHEIAAMVADANVRARVRDAYAMMLEFYGFRLADNDTGRVERSADWAARFAHLDSASHNFLRISRILKSIGDLSFERFKYPLLKLLATEIYQNGQIQSARGSLREYWSESLRNVTELQFMRAMVARYDTNYAGSVNPEVCTELSTCSTPSTPFCANLNSRCGSAPEYCCANGFIPVLVTGICQCVVDTRATTTGADATATSNLDSMTLSLSSSSIASSESTRTTFTSIQTSALEDVSDPEDEVPVRVVVGLALGAAVLICSIGFGVLLFTNKPLVRWLSGVVGARGVLRA